MYKAMLLGVVSALFLTSCFDTSDKNLVDNYLGSCDQVSKNEALFENLQQAYLWNKDLPRSINPSKYKSLNALLQDVKSPKDRFSFLLTEQEYQDRYVNAVYFGYGFSLENRYNEGVMKVRYVYDASPANEVGIERADELIEVNGTAMNKWLNLLRQGAITNEDIFGANEAGVTADLVWRKPNGTTYSAIIAKTQVETNTVFHVQKEQVNNKQVGYFVFDSFIDRSEQDINHAMDALDGVDDLIIDLRYNSGGLIRVANQIASQVAWHKVENKTFLTYRYNDNYYPESVLFSLGAGLTTLDLDRVYVLVTEESCSSSELIINSLTPFIDVVTIGSPTCGKPVGQSPTKICDEILFAINFQTENALGYGDYFNGLPVRCWAEDTLVANWGSNQDPLLFTAYHHLTTGQCPTSFGTLEQSSKLKQQPITHDPWLNKIEREF